MYPHPQFTVSKTTPHASRSHDQRDRYSRYLPHEGGNTLNLEAFVGVYVRQLCWLKFRAFQKKFRFALYGDFTPRTNISTAFL